jgi:hypothetical protein
MQIARDRVARDRAEMGYRGAELVTPAPTLRLPTTPPPAPPTPTNE